MIVSVGSTESRSDASSSSAPGLIAEGISTQRLVVKHSQRYGGTRRRSKRERAFDLLRIETALEQAEENERARMVSGTGTIGKQ